MKNNITSQFATTLNKGFQMTFENGITISVQFGSMNYCERRDSKFPIQGELKMATVSSGTAEIAIWDSSSNDFNFGNDTVVGWVTPDEVADWIYISSTAKDLKQLEYMAIAKKLLMPA